MRFSTAIAKYAAWKRARGVRFARGESALRTLLRSAEDGPLHQVTPKQISAYLDGSRMSAYTWWREYQIIRSFFQFWLSRHKLAGLPMPRPQAALPPPFRPYIFSRTEIVRLLLAIERTPLFDPMTIRTFLLFIYGTGARVYEAINLRVSDINLQNKIVSLRRPDSGGQRRMLPIGRTLRNARRSVPSVKRPTKGKIGSRFCDTQQCTTEAEYIAVQLRAHLRPGAYSSGARLQPDARNARS